MNTMPSAPSWDPKKLPSRPADTTENIHRVSAWIYAGILAIVVVIAAFAGTHWVEVLAVGSIFGAIAGLHAALAAGARRRSGIAKVGSFIVGLLMLLGFPIGTIVGGMLIYNAVQDWPPRHVGPAQAAGPDLRDL